VTNLTIDTTRSWGTSPTTYRAATAFDGNVVLTSPEQADLPDDELIAAAIAEAAKPEACGVQLLADEITIGDWTEL
jgi:hypothetical protein